MDSNGSPPCGVEGSPGSVDVYSPYSDSSDGYSTGLSSPAGTPLALVRRNVESPHYPERTVCSQPGPTSCFTQTNVTQTTVGVMTPLSPSVTCETQTPRSVNCNASVDACVESTSVASATQDMQVRSIGSHAVVQYSTLGNQCDEKAIQQHHITTSCAASETDKRVMVNTYSETSAASLRSISSLATPFTCNTSTEVTVSQSDASPQTTTAVIGSNEFGEFLSQTAALHTGTAGAFSEYVAELLTLLHCSFASEVRGVREAAEISELQYLLHAETVSQSAESLATKVGIERSEAKKERIVFETLLSVERATVAGLKEAVSRLQLVNQELHDSVEIRIAEQVERALANESALHSRQISEMISSFQDQLSCEVASARREQQMLDWEELQQTLKEEFRTLTEEHSRELTELAERCSAAEATVMRERAPQAALLTSLTTQCQELSDSAIRLQSALASSDGRAALADLQRASAEAEVVKLRELLQEADLRYSHERDELSKQLRHARVDLDYWKSTHQQETDWWKSLHEQQQEEIASLRRELHEKGQLHQIKDDETRDWALHQLSLAHWKAAQVKAEAFSSAISDATRKSQSVTPLSCESSSGGRASTDPDLHEPSELSDKNHGYEEDDGVFSDIGSISEPPPEDYDMTDDICELSSPQRKASLLAKRLDEFRESLGQAANLIQRSVATSLERRSEHSSPLRCTPDSNYSRNTLQRSLHSVRSTW